MLKRRSRNLRRTCITRAIGQDRARAKRLTELRFWRLGHLDPMLWEGLRNKEGLSIRDEVKDEIRSKRDKQGRRSTKVWAKIFEEFRTAESLGGLLDGPPEDEGIDDDLIEAVTILHHENPVMWRPCPLVYYLSYCGRLSQPEVFGFLQAIAGCPTLARCPAMRVHGGLPEVLLEGGRTLGAPSSLESDCSNPRCNSSVDI